MEFEKIYRLILILTNETDWQIIPLVVWDVWRGTVDEDTIQICQPDNALGDYDDFDLIRAVAGWNPDRLPAADDEVLATLLEDLYQEAITWR